LILLHRKSLPLKKMFRQISICCVFLTLLIFDGLAVINAHGHYNADAVVNEQEAETQKDTGGICYNFNEIRKLIPDQTLSMILSQHYLFDRRFRKAMDFIESPKFHIASARLANSHFFRYVMDRFEQVGINTSDIDSLVAIFDCIQVPKTSLLLQDKPRPSVYVQRPQQFVPVEAVPLPQTEPQPTPFITPPPNSNQMVIPQQVVHHVVSNLHDDEMDYYDDYSWLSYSRTDSHITSRSLQDLMGEVIDILPKEDVSNLIQENIDKGTQFGEFYKIVRKPFFQKAVVKALNSKEMMPINRLFKKNNLNLRRLLISLFTILNFGPPNY